MQKVTPLDPNKDRVQHASDPDSSHADDGWVLKLLWSLKHHGGGVRTYLEKALSSSFSRRK